MTLVVVNQAEEHFLDLILGVNYTLRLFKNDCTVRVGAWGRQDLFRVVQPFGDLSFVSGAKI